MKALPLLLTLSIVANAALVTTVVLRDEQSATTASDVAAGRTSQSTPVRNPVVSGQLPAAAEIVASLNTADPENLRAVLVAAGLDDDIIRTLVGQRIRERFAARRQAVDALRNNADEWWKDDGDYYSPERREQRQRYKQLNDEMNAELERVLGPSGPRKLSSWEQRRYGDLPSDKIAELRLIESDYRELMGEINAEARDFRLPEDSEKIRFLKQEQMRDLESVLTPAEFEAYQLRNSNTARQLRSAMTRMDATEQEYRLVHDLKSEFDEAYNTNVYTGGVRNDDADFRKARKEAQSQLEERIKGALGQDRYLEYKRSQDYGYRQLQGATDRFGLPPDTPAKSYALRQEIPAAAMAIARNDELKPEQKKEALTRLADQARQRVTALYGADLVDQVLKTQGMRWVEQIENGHITIYDETGRQTESRRVSFK